MQSFPHQLVRPLGLDNHSVVISVIIKQLYTICCIHNIVLPFNWNVGVRFLQNNAGIVLYPPLLFRFIENLADFLLSVAKEIFQLVPHKQTIGKSSQDTQFHPVMHYIRHFYAPFYLAETMLVVPKGIWTILLLVDKIFVLLHLGNYRYPTQRNTQYRAHNIAYQLPRINATSMLLRYNLKPHIRRCNSLQVARAREEIPSGFHIYRQNLYFLQGIHFRHHATKGF